MQQDQNDGPDVRGTDFRIRFAPRRGISGWAQRYLETRRNRQLVAAGCGLFCVLMVLVFGFVRRYRARQVMETAETDSRRLKHETEDFLDQRLGSFEILLDKLSKTKSNEQFLKSMSKG